MKSIRHFSKADRGESYLISNTPCKKRKNHCLFHIEKNKCSCPGQFDNFYVKNKNDENEKRQTGFPFSRGEFAFM